MESVFGIINPCCEYAAEPMGIITPRPRFSFSASVTHVGQRQAAYRILVSDSEQSLHEQRGTLWDSGRVESPSGLNIPYEGAPLHTGDIVWWTVRIWDEKGEATPWCRPLRLVMGLMEGRFSDSFMSFVPGYGPGAAYIKNRFRLDGPVRKAVCFWSGLGYGELYVNGQKADDSVLDPGVSEYTRRYLYRTHDLTGLLREGDNEFLLILGSGWHGSPKYIFRCDIAMDDGSAVRIGSKGPARWTYTPGPVGLNSIYNGECYDARMEAVFANDYESLRPQNVHRSLLDTGSPCPQIMEPIRVVADIRPVSVDEPLEGTFVFDMGQNFAGWARIRVRGAEGTAVTLRYAENLSDDGTVDQGTLRSARNTDTYILKGDPAGESWEPRFTYHGFRYVQVEGYPDTLTADDVTGRVVRSSVAEAGEFECDDELLNHIYRNIKWTEQNNMHGIPTDCPQRDERMGWLNDATVRLEGAQYLYRLPLFYNKWLDDIADTQDETGAIADTAPFNWGNRPADPVCSSYLLLGWNLHLFYGDKTAIADHYEGFKAWEQCLLKHSKDLIVQYSHWGDWCPPIRFTDGGSPRSAATPGQLMSTGYLYYNAVLLSRMAGILGRGEEQRHYEELAGRIREAFNREYFHADSDTYALGSASGNVFALYLGLAPEGREEAVMDNVLRSVEEASGHLTTGNQCTKYLLEMLSEYGHVDTAYEIATKRDYPGWGYMIENGATTVWERWEHETGGGMNSHDHPMMGSIGAWFFKVLGGIRPDWRHPAFERFDLKPFIPGDLDRVNTRHKTLRGDIVSRWEKTGDGLRLTLSVPFGSEATLWLTEKQGIQAPESGTLWVNGQAQPFAPRIPLAAGEYIVEIRG